MADTRDAQEITFDEDPAEDSNAARDNGTGPGLARILMLLGVGLGIVIAIVSIVVITVDILNQQSKPALTAALPEEEYRTATPIYQYVGTIGEIHTHTSDAQPYAITVAINLGFDMKDQDSPVEVNARMPQIRDFLRRYFTGKSAADLTPDKEQLIKDDIRDNLNHILSKPAVKEVLFDRLDVVKIET